LVTQYEAIIEAFEVLGGERTIKEIQRWVSAKYGFRWKDFGTAMADMVPISLGGNVTSQAPEKVRVLKRVARGKYGLIRKHEKQLNKSLQETSRTPTPRHLFNFQHSPSAQIKFKNEALPCFVPDREFWVQGHPAPFSTRGEIIWKDALQRSLPECTSSLNEKGLTLDFQLADLAPRNQPLDVDNLCEPVFSILINKKGWFGGKRPNLYWWRASKCHNTSTGCRIRFYSTNPLAEPSSDTIFNGYYMGPPPRSATDPEMPKWICKMVDEDGIKIYPNTTFYVRLRFDNERLNIGEIATGAVKSTIDCLYPIIGGEAGRPEDWRITILQIEKNSAVSDDRGVHITVQKMSDS